MISVGAPLEVSERTGRGCWLWSPEAWRDRSSSSGLCKGVECCDQAVSQGAAAAADDDDPGADDPAAYFSVAC